MLDVDFDDKCLNVNLKYTMHGTNCNIVLLFWLGTVVQCHFPNSKNLGVKKCLLYD